MTVFVVSDIVCYGPVCDASHIGLLNKTELQTALQELIGDTLYPCNAAKGVLARSSIDLCVVDMMTSPEAVRTVQARLTAFGQRETDGLVSFIAAFNAQPIYCKHQFDTLLWDFLQKVHNFDGLCYPWDETVSSDPDDPNFSFSVGGRAYYLIGLNPHSSRKARQFCVPAIVFNLHSQFEALRRRGKYARLRDTVRANDVRYSGSVNPMLRDFGSASETVQYSGEQHEETWQCPLQIKVA